jgi:hypothetical protein
MPVSGHYHPSPVKTLSKKETIPFEKGSIKSNL